MNATVTVTPRLVDDEARRELRELLRLAYDGQFTDDDWSNGLDGIHVIARQAEELVGHASIVPRRFSIGDARVTVGYVEAVAVHPRHRRRGVGARVMLAVESALGGQRRPGALSPTQMAHDLYQRRGWQPWTGPLLEPAGGGRTVAATDEVVLVWTRSVDEMIDVSQPMTADWRAGDIW